MIYNMQLTRDLNIQARYVEENKRGCGIWQQRDTGKTHYTLTLSGV